MPVVHRGGAKEAESADPPSEQPEIEISDPRKTRHMKKNQSARVFGLVPAGSGLTAALASKTAHKNPELSFAGAEYR